MPAIAIVHAVYMLNTLAIADIGGRPKGFGDSEPGRTAAFQLASAVQHCHALGVAHRDIKPENVLNFGPSLRCSVHVKLCDFGGASVSSTAPAPGSNPNESRMYSSRPVGSKQYTAPEVLSTLDDLNRMAAERRASGGAPRGNTDEKPRYYDVKLADVWSYAVTVFVLCSGRAPFKEARGTDAHFLAFLQSTQPGVVGSPLCPLSSISAEAREGAAGIKWIWPRHFSQPLIDLLAACLNIDPEQRPNMDAVIRCEYFFPSAKPSRDASMEADREPISASAGTPEHSREEDAPGSPQQQRSPVSASRGRRLRPPSWGAGALQQQRLRRIDTEAASVASRQSSASHLAGTSVREASVCRSTNGEQGGAAVLSPSLHSRDVSVTSQRNALSPPRGAPYTARGEDGDSVHERFGFEATSGKIAQRQASTGSLAGSGGRSQSQASSKSDRGTLSRLHEQDERAAAAGTPAMSSSVLGGAGSGRLPPITGHAAPRSDRQARLSVPCLGDAPSERPVLRYAHSASSAAMHSGMHMAETAAAGGGAEATTGGGSRSTRLAPREWTLGTKRLLWGRQLTAAQLTGGTMRLPTRPVGPSLSTCQRPRPACSGGRRS